jgi:hypothetical protein
MGFIGQQKYVDLVFSTNTSSKSLFQKDNKNGYLLRKASGKQTMCYRARCILL